MRTQSHHSITIRKLEQNLKQILHLIVTSYTDSVPFYHHKNLHFHTRSLLESQRWRQRPSLAPPLGRPFLILRGARPWLNRFSPLVWLIDRSIILSPGFDLLSLIYEVSSFAPPNFLVVASVIIAEWMYLSLSLREWRKNRAKTETRSITIRRIPNGRLVVGEFVWIFMVFTECKHGKVLITGSPRKMGNKPGVT